MKYSLQDLRSIPIFFVVGKGRSGTTLLSNILDSHPNVASATESRFILILWLKYRNMKRWKPEMAEAFYEVLLQDYRIKYLWEFEDDFIPQLKLLPAETTVQDLIKMVYLFKKSLFAKEKIHYIIDKNPRYTLFLDRMHLIFNDAKFIRIIRDPRDNVVSSIKYSKKKVGAIGYKWYMYNKAFDDFAAKYPSLCHTKAFEQLILDKETYFSEFEEFTGIHGLAKIESNRLNIKDEFEGKFTEKLRVQHQGSVKPLDAKKVGHFKSKLTEQQIKAIEAHVFPYAEKHGYEKTTAVEPIGTSKKNKLDLKHRYRFMKHALLYRLPYPLFIAVRKFMLENVSKAKKEKLDHLINE